jgi:hypothetical protein
LQPFAGLVWRPGRGIRPLSGNDKQIPDHGCHQWHWVGGGRSARRTRRESRYCRSQQDQDAHCVGSHQGGGREESDGGDIHRRPLVAGLGAQIGRRGAGPLSKAGCARQQCWRDVRNTAADEGRHRTDLGGQPPGAVSAQQAPPPPAEGECAGPHHHHGTQAHQGAHIPFDDLNAERSYRGCRYCETKLANILFTTELARRLDGTGVTANCFHPGLVATGFNRNNGLLMDLGEERDHRR